MPGNAKIGMPPILIRQELANLGVTLEDRADGTIWKVDVNPLKDFVNLLHAYLFSILTCLPSTAGITMRENWYALRVKPHKEKSVQQRPGGRSDRGLPASGRVQPTNPRSAQIKPYFPGYMFVFTDIKETGTNKFKWLPGAIGLVEFGDIPAVVPTNLINDLQQLIERIKKEGGLAKFEFSPGDNVRIVDGPFEGYEAMFDLHLPGADRAQVLLAFLSQAPQPLQLNSAEIKKIEE